MVEICACADISNIEKLGSDISVDINKIQTDFPQSEILSQSRMHTPRLLSKILDPLLDEPPNVLYHEKSSMAFNVTLAQRF